jgi:DNA-binding GntR family transcriptional regulator
MTSLPPRGRTAEVAARVAVAPLEDTSTFADRAYTALKDVILSLDIYDRPGEVRLDERRLASDLGISRTPVREAMAQLEREGFVRSVPRRGIYVVRKTRAEVVELITAWAALESMAARLITQNATDPEIAELRAMFATFENGRLHANLDEYSEVNIEARDTARAEALVRDHALGLAEHVMRHAHYLD